MSKFWESIKRIFSLKVSKNYFYQVYGKKCGQTCQIWSKYVIFGENCQNGVILGAKMTSYVKIFGKWSNKFFPKGFEKLF